MKHENQGKKKLQIWADEVSARLATALERADLPVAWIANFQTGTSPAGREI